MIDILLAVYNGEKYLTGQIDSLLSQSYKNIHIVIRDDGSSDGSVGIIEKYAAKYPEIIDFDVNKKNSGSPRANFFSMLAQSRGEYVMFCDQDDIWTDNKVKLSLEKMKRAEESYGSNTPILVHSDLMVVDENVFPVSMSMFHLQHLNSKRTGVRNLLVQNIVTGCTMMLNRSLVDRLSYTPKMVPLHDWWIALFTACCGRIVFLDVPTVLYRRHEKNYCGPQDMSSPAYLMNRAKNGKRNRQMLIYGYKQAAEMAEAYGSGILGEKNYALLKGYGELENKPYPQRLWYVLSKGILKSGVIRKIGQFIYL